MNLKVALLILAVASLGSTVPTSFKSRVLEGRAGAFMDFFRAVDRINPMHNFKKLVSRTVNWLTSDNEEKGVANTPPVDKIAMDNSVPPGNTEPLGDVEDVTEVEEIRNSSGIEEVSDATTVAQESPPEGKERICHLLPDRRLACSPDRDHPDAEDDSLAPVTAIGSLAGVTGIGLLACMTTRCGTRIQVSAMPPEEGRVGPVSGWDGEVAHDILGDVEMAVQAGDRLGPLEPLVLEAAL